MKINFSQVGKRRRVDNKGQYGLQMRLSEPVWITNDGEVFPISELHNEHLQRIERWLRGGGATAPAEWAYDKWHHIIFAEMTKRKLPMLVDHPDSYRRNPADRIPGEDPNRYQYDMVDAGAYVFNNLGQSTRRVDPSANPAPNTEGIKTSRYSTITGQAIIRVDPGRSPEDYLKEEVYSELAERLRKRLTQREFLEYYQCTFPAEEDK